MSKQKTKTKPKQEPEVKKPIQKKSILKKDSGNYPMS
jgi:hypothetical protein